MISPAVLPLLPCDPRQSRDGRRRSAVRDGFTGFVTEPPESDDVAAVRSSAEALPKERRAMPFVVSPVAAAIVLFLLLLRVEEDADDASALTVVVVVVVVDAVPVAGADNADADHADAVTDHADNADGAAAR